MGKIKKKGTSGNAKNFITRTQAVKKLQIELPDFRRLCIFKGIYPREPRNKKKANKGSTAPTTFYYTKDIQYLLHEPVLQKFREHKTFAKKLSKALGRGDYSDAKRLEQLHKPKVKLDHIVKERYPSFTDALRDLDDAVSMLFLFANLPSNHDIPVQTIATCERLTNEFQHYIIRTNALRKTFLSIKGIYYQAEIHGQSILWLVPYKFAQNVPVDVDFRIMLTFVDFYTTLLGFVLFRLYTMEGLVYPPKFNAKMDENAAGLRAFSLENKGVGLLKNGENEQATSGDVSRQMATLESKIASLNQEDQGDDKPEDAAEDVSAETDKLDTFVPAVAKDTTVDILQQPGANTNGQVGSDPSQLFAKHTFYLSRETPRQPLEFILRSFGCKRMGWDAVLGDGSYTESDLDPSITHHVIDRPPIMGAAPYNEDMEMEGAAKRPANGRIPGRIYVQPQYVWDCVNAGRLLRPDAYAQGAELPPHLSPWQQAKEGEYDPTAPLPQTEDIEESEDEETEPLALENGTSQDVEDEVDEEWNGMDTAGSDDNDEDESAEEEQEPKNGTTVKSNDDEDDEITSDPDDEELARIEAQRELEAEAAGIPYEPSTKKQTKTKSDTKLTEAQKKKQTEKEEMERQKIMMTKKKRKLYEKMMYGNQKKADEVEKLVTKRRKIEKEKKQKAK